MAVTPATLVETAVISCESELTVAELTAAYLDFANGYYFKDGKPTRRIEHIKYAIKSLLALYGFTVAKEFGPKALKSCRANHDRKALELGVYQR